MSVSIGNGFAGREFLMRSQHNQTFRVLYGIITVVFVFACVLVPDLLYRQTRHVVQTVSAPYRVVGDTSVVFRLEEPTVTQSELTVAGWIRENGAGRGMEIENKGCICAVVLRKETGGNFLRLPTAVVSSTKVDSGLRGAAVQPFGGFIAKAPRSGLSGDGAYKIYLMYEKADRFQLIDTKQTLRLS